MSHRVRRLAIGLTITAVALAAVALIGSSLTHAQSLRQLYLPLGAKRLAQSTAHPTTVPSTPHPTYPPHNTPIPGTPHPTYPPHNTPTPGTPHATQPPYPTHPPATPCPTQLPHPAAPPVVVVPRAIEPDEWFHDQVVIQSAVVTGDTLALTVSYSGGCRDHDLWLVASSLFMESAPPQVDVLVSHNGHGDACEAIMRRDLAFDLAPLRRTATGGVAGHGTLILRLRGWPEGLRYDY